jgi:hypothetical protein
MMVQDRLRASATSMVVLKMSTRFAWRGPLEASLIKWT